MDKQPRSWTFDIATAAASGVATAYLPMHRWSRGAQWALHGGMGALAGALTGGAGVAHGYRIATATSLATAVGVATAGLSRGGQGLDTWAEQRLTARGVRRPRLWIGLAAAGVTLAISAAERLDQGKGSPGSDGGVPGAGG